MINATYELLKVSWKEITIIKQLLRKKIRSAERRVSQEPQGAGCFVGQGRDTERANWPSLLSDNRPDS